MFECRNCGVSKTLDAFYKRTDGHGNGYEKTCKECKNTRQKKRKEENKEHYAQKGRESSKRWRDRNPEKVVEQNKKFRLENPDYASKHRKENPEIYKAARDKHYYENGGREKTIERNRKRKALIAGGRHEDYSVADVLSRYGEDCYLCGEAIDLNAPRWTKEKGWENGLHIEHYVDIACGGDDTLENVRPSHGLCNTKKKPFGGNNV
jgi:hypothetical protein